MITSEIEYRSILERIHEEVKRLIELTDSESSNDLDIINSHKKLCLLHEDAFQYQSQRVFKANTESDDGLKLKKS